MDRKSSKSESGGERLEGSKTEGPRPPAKARGEPAKSLFDPSPASLDPLVRPVDHAKAPNGPARSPSDPARTLRKPASTWGDPAKSEIGPSPSPRNSSLTSPDSSQTSRKAAITWRDSSQSQFRPAKGPAESSKSHAEVSRASGRSLREPFPALKRRFASGGLAGRARTAPSPVVALGRVVPAKGTGVLDAVPPTPPGRPNRGLAAESGVRDTDFAPGFLQAAACGCGDSKWKASRPPASRLLRECRASSCRPRRSSLGSKADPTRGPPGLR